MLAFMNPTGAFLFKVMSPKVLIGLGSSIGVLAMVLASLAATYTQFLWCFAVMYGMGIGICYFSPLACGWEWMPERKGLVTGVILGAFGFGAFVFSFISQWVVNPDNHQAQKLEDGRLIYAPEIAQRVSLFSLGQILITFFSIFRSLK